MKTLNRQSIAEQVRHNCDISDARYAGLFSVCGLALRLRDLYKWEHRLEPWQESESSVVLEWIGKKEDRWEQIADRTYRPLRITDGTYDVFDTEALNRVLMPQGLYYGAGYARSLKPTFFLAGIEYVEQLDGVDVFYLGREFARDLLNLPALNQDNQIVLRQESARAYLWDQIAYINKSGQTALHAALAECGLTDYRAPHVRKHLDTIWTRQRQTYIYHELGEMQDRVFTDRIWREIIAAFPHSRTELLVRAVKDLLADTGPNGTLCRLMQDGNTAAIGFYAAFTDGLIKELFPEIRDAFADFARSRNWETFASVVEQGYDTARCFAERIMGVYRQAESGINPAQTQALIETMLPESVQRSDPSTDRI